MAIFQCSECFLDAIKPESPSQREKKTLYRETLQSILYNYSNRISFNIIIPPIHTFIFHKLSIIRTLNQILYFMFPALCYPPFLLISNYEPQNYCHEAPTARV